MYIGQDPDTGRYNIFCADARSPSFSGVNRQGLVQECISELEIIAEKASTNAESK